jgi:hypothetical protein
VSGIEATEAATPEATEATPATAYGYGVTSGRRALGRNWRFSAQLARIIHDGMSLGR